MLRHVSSAESNSGEHQDNQFDSQSELRDAQHRKRLEIIRAHSLADLHDELSGLRESLGLHRKSSGQEGEAAAPQAQEQQQPQPQVPEKREVEEEAEGEGEEAPRNAEAAQGQQATQGQAEGAEATGNSIGGMLSDGVGLLAGLFTPKGNDAAGE